MIKTYDIKPECLITENESNEGIYCLTDEVMSVIDSLVIAYNQDTGSDCDTPDEIIGRSAIKKFD